MIGKNLQSQHIFIYISGHETERTGTNKLFLRHVSFDCHHLINYPVKAKHVDVFVWLTQCNRGLREKEVVHKVIKETAREREPLRKFCGLYLLVLGQGEKAE